MSFEAALILAFILLVTTFVAVISVVRSRFTAARDEELKQQSSMRGWSFETARENGFRVQRWKGSTDGVEWIVESRHRPGGHNKQSIRRSRWLATAVRGPEKPILCMGVPPGKEDPTVKFAQGEGFFANLAKKAVGFAFDKAVDQYFGEEIGKVVDARELKPVPGTTVPGYSILAADPDAASRILFQGLTRALSASPPPALRYDDEKAPWVLLWKGGVGLGKSELIETVEEVEWLTRLGSSIARLPIV